MKTKLLALLPLALLPLALLSACGQRGASPETGEKPDAIAEEADAAKRQAADDASFAAEEATRTRDAAAAAEGAAKRVAMYKRELLPLIAGNFPGECISAKDGAKARAAIAVAADGTVSAPGMKAHSLMDAGAVVTVGRLGSVDKPKMLTFQAVAEAGNWIVGRQSAAEVSTMYMADKEGLTCVNEAPAAQASTQSVYPAVAKFFIAAARTFTCIDGTALPKPYKVTPAATSVTIGDDTFSLVDANAGASVMAGPGDAGLMYRMEVIDGPSVAIVLDQAGAMSMFSASRGASKKIYLCQAPGQ